ncbi:host attachment protein [Methylocapsa aurea]|uniref:host attachment protein n=1 Tax=Methylocapsa aurea TaxID=663610 RepID=UPI000565B453|nr:host attachment protein [Methylocapsa aurea]
MPHLRIRTGDWVIVVDGRKALLLENEGDDEILNLKTREVREHADAPNRLLNSDKPGRVHESATSSRSSVEQTDRHEDEERAFIAGVAARLEEAIAAGGVKGFIIVAPAHVLGLIRKGYSASVKAAIRAEIERDLTHLPVYEIEQRLLKWEEGRTT